MIANLQALRFVAGLIVLLAHVEHEAIDVGLRTAIETPIRGGFGVDIFFVISGFVMYLTTAHRFGEPGAFRAFLWKRIVRVVPIYWVFTTLTLVSMVVFPAVMRHDVIDPRHVVASYLFIPYPRPNGDLNPILSLGWTLNFEMFFYAMFALALLARRSLGIPLLIGGFVLLALIHPLVPPSWPPLFFWSRPIVLEFIAGIGLAIVFRKGYRLPGWLAVAVIAAGFAIVALLPGLRWLTSGSAALLVTAGVVLFRDLTYSGVVGRMVLFGGDASYALYLSHPFAINGLGLVWRKLGLPGFLISAVVASVVAAMLVHQLVERPLMRWLGGRGR